MKELPTNIKERMLLNEEDIIEILKEHKGLSRAELVKKSGIARSTLYEALERLVVKGKVKRTKKRVTDATRGRLTVIWTATV